MLDEFVELLLLEKRFAHATESTHSNERTSGATHRYSGGGPGITQKAAKPPPIVAAQRQLGSGARRSNDKAVTKLAKRFAGTGNRTGRYSNPCERSHGRRGTNIENLFRQKCAKFRDLAGKKKIK